MNPQFATFDSYIYLYHTNTFIVLPVYPESVSDIDQANFSPSTPLSRSAPIYSFTSSGPRQVGFTLVLHRDMMNEVNQGVSNVGVEVGKDYVDTLINQIQACALPNYDSARKMVDPPMVALQLGSEIFIKGVVIGGPNITYSGPLIGKKDDNGNYIDGECRYSMVSIGITINEIDPFSADTIMQMGSFRGITTSIEDRLFGRAIPRS